MNKSNLLLYVDSLSHTMSLICRRETTESIIPGIFTPLMVIVFSMNNFIYLWTGIFDKDVTRLKILTGTYLRIHFYT